MGIFSGGLGGIFKAAVSFFSGGIGGFLFDIGASYILDKYLGGDDDQGDQPDPGVEVRARSDTKNKLPVIYGESYVGGMEIAKFYNSDQSKLGVIIGLCDHPVNSIEEIWIGGFKLGFPTGGANTVKNSLQSVTSTASDDGESNDDYHGGRIKFQLFENGGTCAPMNALNGDWDASNTAPITFVYVEVSYDRDRGIYGVPSDLKFRVKGREVKGTSLGDRSYSTNPALCALDYWLDDRYGAGLSPSDLDMVSIGNHASHCAGTVSYNNLLDVSTDGPRFSCNGVINTQRNISSNVRQLLAGNGGFATYSFGKFGILSDKADDSVASISTDDMYGKVQVTSGTDKDLLNKLVLTFPDRNAKGAQDQIELNVSENLLGEHEVPYEKTLHLPFTDKNFEAQRIGAIMLNSARQSLTVSFKLPLKYLFLQPMDVIKVTDPLNGFVAKEFRIDRVNEIIGGGDTPMVMLQFECQEYSKLLYIDGHLNENDVAPNTSFKSTFGTSAVTGLSASEDTSVVEANLQVTWGYPNPQLVDRYEVQWRISGSSEEYVTGTTDGSKFNITGIETAKTYSVQVRAVSDIGRKSTFETVAGGTGNSRIPAVSGASRPFYRKIYTNSATEPNEPTGGSWTQDNSTFTTPYDWTQLPDKDSLIQRWEVDALIDPAGEGTKGNATVTFNNLTGQTTSAAETKQMNIAVSGNKSGTTSAQSGVKQDTDIVFRGYSDNGVQPITVTVALTGNFRLGSLSTASDYLSFGSINDDKTFDGYVNEGETYTAAQYVQYLAQRINLEYAGTYSATYTTTTLTIQRDNIFSDQFYLNFRLSSPQTNTILITGNPEDTGVQGTTFNDSDADGTGFVNVGTSASPLNYEATAGQQFDAWTLKLPGQYANPTQVGTVDVTGTFTNTEDPDELAASVRLGVQTEIDAGNLQSFTMPTRTDNILEINSSVTGDLDDIEFDIVVTGYNSSARAEVITEIQGTDDFTGLATIYKIEYGNQTITRTLGSETTSAAILTALNGHFTSEITGWTAGTVSSGSFNITRTASGDADDVVITITQPGTNSDIGLDTTLVNQGADEATLLNEFTIEIHAIEYKFFVANGSSATLQASTAQTFLTDKSDVFTVDADSGVLTISYEVNGSLKAVSASITTGLGGQTATNPAVVNNDGTAAVIHYGPVTKDGEAGTIESLERYTTVSPGLRTQIGDPTTPGTGVTWLPQANLSIPSEAFWVADRLTVAGETSGWEVRQVQERPNGLPFLTHQIFRSSPAAPALGSVQWETDVLEAADRYTGQDYSVIEEIGYGTSVLIYYNIDGAQSFVSGTYKKSGNVGIWVLPAQVIPGDAIIDGTLTAEKIQTLDLTAEQRIKVGDLQVDYNGEIVSGSGAILSGDGKIAVGNVLKSMVFNPETGEITFKGVIINAANIVIDGTTLVNNNGVLEVGIISNLQVNEPTIDLGVIDTTYNVITDVRSYSQSVTIASIDASGISQTGSEVFSVDGKDAGNLELTLTAGNCYISSRVRANGGESHGVLAYYFNNRPTYQGGDGGNITITVDNGNLKLLGEQGLTSFTVQANGGDGGGIKNGNSGGFDPNPATTHNPKAGGNGGAISLNAPNGCVEITGGIQHNAGDPGDDITSVSHSLTVGAGGATGSLTQSFATDNACII